MTAKVDTSLHGVSRAIEGLDVDGLRRAIQEEYTLVAAEPERGFHFHTGRRQMHAGKNANRTACRLESPLRHGAPSTAS